MKSLKRKVCYDLRPINMVRFLEQAPYFLALESVNYFVGNIISINITDRVIDSLRWIE